ncbi:MAG: hypothetical protein JSU01_15070 [Bacteroidetes bacterium]|nr:hypothetical protein [Bacteroidota bacterium]
MGLFSIFKKKQEPEKVIIPTDGIKALADGILFEDGDVFLKWGADIEASKFYAKKEYRADRVIYQWGEKSILNGLKLPLKTVCWNHKQHGDIKSFESVDFLVEGEAAEGQFRSLKEHIENIFGAPKSYDDLQPGEVSLEWKIKAVKIALNFFNKERPKVQLEIGWWL